jgi:serine/threonine protein kinase
MELKSNNSNVQPIYPGATLPDGLQLIDSIGKGSFSEIYAALRKPDQTLVAVKIQSPDFDSSVLRWEGQVMQIISQASCAPQFYSMGQHEQRDYLVMELLTGEDMASLRNRVRSSQPSGLVPLPLVAYLAREMVTCLQEMHQKGLVHRDVKPSNFVRRSVDVTKFCVIDFGLVKQVSII